MKFGINLNLIIKNDQYLSKFQSILIFELNLDLNLKYKPLLLIIFINYSANKPKDSIIFLYIIPKIESSKLSKKFYNYYKLF